MQDERVGPEHAVGERRGRVVDGEEHGPAHATERRGALERATNAVAVERRASKDDRVETSELRDGTGDVTTEKDLGEERRSLFAVPREGHDHFGDDADGVLEADPFAPQKSGDLPGEKVPEADDGRAPLGRVHGTIGARSAPVVERVLRSLFSLVFHHLTEINKRRVPPYRTYATPTYPLMMSSMPTSGSPQEIPPVTGLSLRPGDVVGGRFHLTAQLDDGPPCARFAAVQTDTGVPVEVQVFTVDESLAAASRELVDRVRLRFLADARKAASLRSIHTAGILQVGVTDQGDPFLVTEAIADGTLASLMKEVGGLPTEHAVDIALAVCDSLVEAHAHGLVHGSLDPRCIHLAWSEEGPSRVKVADLGTARALASLPVDLRPGQPLVLRAPELLQHGREADARSDIWSLAVIVYTMLAGEPPFGTETPSTVNLSIMLDEQTLLAGVPDALAETVDACLSKAPQLRARTMKAFSEELGPFGSRPFVATPPSLRAIDTGRFEAVELERLKEESGGAPVPVPVSVMELGDEDLIEEEISEFDDTIRGSTAVVLRPSPLPPLTAVARVAPPVPPTPPPPADLTPLVPNVVPVAAMPELPKPPSVDTRAALPAAPPPTPAPAQATSVRAPLPPPPSTKMRAALPPTPTPTPTPGQATTEPLPRRSVAPVSVTVAPPAPPVRLPPRPSVPLAKTLEPAPAKRFSTSTLAVAAAFLAVGVGIGTYTSRSKETAAATEAPAAVAETVAAPTSAPVETVATASHSQSVAPPTTAAADTGVRIPLAPPSMGVAQLPEAPATPTAAPRPVPVAAKPRAATPAPKAAAAAPAPAPKTDATDSLVRSAAAPIQPEPKASNDDLHKFLDDRR